MALYLPSEEGGALRQCEILEEVLEIRFDTAELSAQSIYSEHPPSLRVRHPWSIVLSPDCDLEWDFLARAGDANQATKLISHVLMCDLEDEAGVRSHRIKGRDLLSRAKSNREERFHYIPGSSIEGRYELHGFFIDFKGLFSVPTSYLYGVLNLGVVKRHGVLKPPWAQHLTDRFTYFLGRVGLPDME